MDRVRQVLIAALLLALAGCASARPKTPLLLPELVLDIEKPVIEAQVAGVTLRLRVDLDRHDTIELNPAAAARLALPFEAGAGADVGRVAVDERVAVAQVAIGGVTTGRTVSVFDRDCCADADGAVGPDLLPYAVVRFVRSGDSGGGALALPLIRSSESGLTTAAATPAGRILVRFSLAYRGTLATAAAGAILAKGYGGRLAGDSFEVAPAFGVERPARTLALERPAMLAGFAIASLPVRTADFGGGMALPREPAEAGDILVSGHGPRPQSAWPTVLIGRDRLDRCSELTFRRAAMELVLRCRFD